MVSWLALWASAEMVTEYAGTCGAGAGEIAPDLATGRGGWMISVKLSSGVKGSTTVPVPVELKLSTLRRLR
ncbi:hypothetical protein VTI74DRAFT_6545 [Chaetomium olivicolor]